MTRTALSLVVVAAAVSACSSWTPPPPPPEAHVIPPMPVEGFGTPRKIDKHAANTPAEKFAVLRDRVLDAWLADEPSMGRELGLHEWDGRVPKCDAASLTARYARITKERAELAAFDKVKLSPDDKLDLLLLESQADMYLFKGAELQKWKKEPQWYEDLFSVNVYLDRDYAPVAERAARLLQHERAALAEIPNIRKNLVGPMSKPVVDTAIKIYRGYASYLRADVLSQVKGVGAPDFQEELAKTNEALAKEATALADWLEKTELPRGDDSHILGPKRFKHLLHAQEGLDISLAEFKKMGEDNLQANKRAYEKLVGKAHFTRPKVEELFGAGGRIMEAARQFVVAKHFATIPTDDKAVVRETPPYQRWNSAFLDMPGPYESRVGASFYYITLPDPKWSKKEQADYLMPMGILLSTTIHETYPGHFLQGQWVKRAPTRAQKMIGSYSFIEGWAHYGEQAMIELGFGADDPQNQLGQLSDALLRNCRLVVSLGIHTEHMTLKQAEQRFMNDCKQDKATAREQAVRGTFDPGYFAYTLGKLQILALRDEAKKKLGAKFDLGKFHDELLSHGSPPVPLIHDRVLADLEAAAR
ncbi:MAG TPA: DUF885 domain-containing protein [Byssovorax sp.]|jgi:uncharacterized protein (DUF885 family)